MKKFWQPAILFFVTLVLTFIISDLLMPNNSGDNLSLNNPTINNQTQASVSVNTDKSDNSVQLISETGKSSPSSLGINLSPISDWSTEMPFLDAFKSSRKWLTQCQATQPDCTSGWDTQEFDLLDLDENGWVKSLPTPEATPKYTSVGTLMFRDVVNYPGGKYIVLYDGEGTINYQFDAKKDVSLSKPGRDVINVTPSNGGIFLSITKTDPNKTGNYIKNIRVVKEESEKTYQSETFNPLFIERIKAFKAIRFMDWMETNNSEQQEWQNRPQIDKASYAYGGGVPIEIMVKLVNKLKVDPWFNIPHKADDEYITNFAKLVQEKLDPNLTAYVEYSNEVWNGQFQQFAWVKNNGIIKDQQVPYQSYGVRSAQICDIWQGVFGQESKRVKCILAGQTVNPWVANQILNCDKWEKAPCYKHGIDALAITSYFGWSFGKQENEQTIMSWLNNPNLDEYQLAIQQLKDGSILGAGDSLKDLKKYFQDYTKLAQEKAIELLAYEGGSHVVGLGKVMNNDRITEFFIQLHRQPEFYGLYQEMLQNWQDTQGIRTLFMHFSNIARPSKFGSWGALENVQETSSPRYDALMNFIAEGRKSQK